MSADIIAIENRLWALQYQRDGKLLTDCDNLLDVAFCDLKMEARWT
jgi:hypothetical protein